MKTLQISEANARKLYKIASVEFKQTLLDSFGEKFFKEKITDRINSFEDACKEEGEDITNPKFWQGAKDTCAYERLKVWVKALNEEWVPDFANGNQPKYEPRFIYKSGVGFSYIVCANWSAHTAVGSRLCYATPELAEAGAKKAIKDYNDYL